MIAQEWFERWFGEEYKRLYPHRDGEQAALQVEALLKAVQAARESSPSRTFHDILDIGCGAGRHLSALRQAFLRDKGPHAKVSHIVGIDLSPVMLRDARAAGLPVARADMRRLPFAGATFDLVACFFTSFGYFATAAEDAATLGEFARVMRPGGMLFLDLPNRATVLRELVASESIVSEGRRVDITRALEGDTVVKRIRISGEVFEERVRLYSRATLGPVFSQLGLEVVSVLGDERGAPFDSATSPRMSLLLRSTAEAA
jgi:SAM-dependent methyltransferase